MGWMDDAMVELRPWIGRVRMVEDDLGMMAVAYWMVHAPRSVFPALNGGDAAILFCFVFLYFVFSGPGAWSLDRKS